MPNRCVVYGCNHTPNLKEGIVLHKIPFWRDERPEAKTRRRWIAFITQKRARWEPEEGSSVCSKHFNPEDFLRLFFMLPGQEKPVIPRLKRDGFGVDVFPTVQSLSSLSSESKLSERSRRRVSIV